MKSEIPTAYCTSTNVQLNEKWQLSIKERHFYVFTLVFGRKYSNVPEDLVSSLCTFGSVLCETVDQAHILMQCS